LKKGDIWDAKPPGIVVDNGLDKKTHPYPEELTTGLGPSSRHQHGFV
jgi:hypothetical protein